MAGSAASVAQDDPAPFDARSVPFGAGSIVGASRMGRSHVQAGAFREDAFEVAGSRYGERRWFAVAVADGLGSCPLSRVGARAAAEEAVRRLSIGHAQLAASPRRVASEAARAAQEAVRAAATARGVPVEDLSSTLILAAGVETTEGWVLSTFQAGDGLVAAASWSGKLHDLGGVDDHTYTGEVNPLLSREVEETWAKRFRAVRYRKAPDAILAMTDGLADDLIPRDANGPILMAEVGVALGQPEPAAALLRSLDYEKAGSFDDRTLVVVPLQPLPGVRP